MSKRIPRHRKRKAEKSQQKSKRELLVILCSLLCLPVALGVMARWPHLPGMTRPWTPPPPGNFNANSPSKEYIYAGGRLIATEEPSLAAAPPAPTGFLAVPQYSPVLVHLSWNLPAPIAFDHYRVERKQSKSHNYTVVNNNLANTSTSFNDSSAVFNTAYLYRICAVVGSSSTCSEPDLVTTTVLQDYQLQADQTPIKAQHFIDLMSAVNAVRVLAEIPTISWSPQNPVPAVGGGIYATHFNDLRAGLSDAFNGLGLSGTKYELPAAVSSNTRVYANPMKRLQELVR